MTDGEHVPLFSVLLPSRNRLELLKHAVASVLGQEFDDLEIIVSDNASDDDYATYLASLNDPRIRCIRIEMAVPVTENWNRALYASRGQYVVMLGDDDALAPGCLARAQDLITAFAHPDAIYAMAYHYAYPGVLTAAPDGYLATVKPQPIYDGRAGAYLHDTAASRRLGRQALRFRHLLNFNSQHFIWSRAFIDSLAGFGAFFQSPYPDFYSSFVTMLKAERIVVAPEPGAIIGISRQSFGFFYNNDQIDAGNDMLKLSASDADAVATVSPEVAEALAFPGSPHYRNWLIAALSVLKNLGPSEELWVDFRRYRRIQIFETTYRRYYLGKGDARSARDFHEKLTRYERGLSDKLSWLFAATRRSPSFSPELVHDALFALHRIHSGDAIMFHDIEGHRNIMDAWNWLADGVHPLSIFPERRDPLREAIKAKDVHIGKLNAHINELGQQMGDKDLRIDELTALIRSPTALIFQLMKLARRSLGRAIPSSRSIN